MALTVATRGCEGHALVVSVDSRVSIRSVIHSRRTHVLTRPLAAQEALLSVSSPRCPRPVHLSSLRLLSAQEESEANSSVPTRGIGDVSAAAAAVPAGSAAPGEALPSPAPEGGAGGSNARTITIGTAVGSGFLTGADPRYQQTLIDHFQGVTPENEMKWETIEPADGGFEFGPAEQIVDFAMAHNMTVHGHNLVWFKQLPNWLTSRSWSRSELMAVLHRHIETVVGHFRGQVHEWDVVNEPFNNDGTLVSDLWSTVIGPEYIALALRWAHEADPTAKLFINDYNVDWNGPKEMAMLQLATTLKNESVPLDGIGMEEHLSLNWAPTEQQVEQSMSSYQALGLEVEVTEMDVDTTGFQGTPEQAEEKQAEIFGSVARACRATPACSRFSVWGVSDAVSWLGAAAAGLPFNSNYNPKRAWLAIQTGLANP